MTTYRPLPSNLTIKESHIEGLGLFATELIEDGVNLGLTHIPNKYSINAYIRTPLGGFINHSERPNCKLSDVGEGRLHLFTTKEIKPGDELTLKYKLYIPKK